MLRHALLVLAACVLAGGISEAQFKNRGLEGGIGFGGVVGKTSLSNNDVKFIGRAFLRHKIVKRLQGELGVELGKIAGNDNTSGAEYETRLVPIDFRLVLSPFALSGWNPYVYGGIGALYAQYITKPENTTVDKSSILTGVVPLGVGAQFPLGKDVVFEMGGGYNLTFSDQLAGFVDTKKNSYWSFRLGLTAMAHDGSIDTDGDGLTDDEEAAIGTDPNKQDTDGDGLIDYEEVKKYHTDPLKADTDGDGLTDGDEVMKYHTDPLKADTDGDGLTDADEVTRYHTDPLKADTDGDGLTDGDEVLKYHTDPLKTDTDGDALTDGDEVLKYHTDPLKSDTDGGSVNDGQEITNRTNPLDPTDDIPKPAIQTIEVGKAIVLEGIVFQSGKATIEPQSEETLMQAFNTLKDNPEISVEIRGYTDNVGSVAANKKLSLRRADAVKTWLVKNGIQPERIGTKGYGPENPIGDNATEDGRAKNRRIEFFRAK